jgi:RNA polymerase primary sigma factor
MSLSAGSTLAVRAVLARSPDLNARDPSGRTALMIAAANGHIECARLLLEAGSEPDATDLLGSNAGDYAARAGHAQLASLVSDYVNCLAEPKPDLVREAADEPFHSADDPHLSPTAGNSGRSYKSGPAESVAAPVNCVSSLSEIDLWIEDEQPSEPQQDVSILSRAGVVQELLSDVAGTFDDEEWSDTALSLPPARTLQSKSSTSLEPAGAARPILAAALEAGFLLLPESGSGELDGDAIHILERLASDAGLLLADPRDPWIANLPPRDAPRSAMLELLVREFASRMDQLGTRAAIELELEKHHGLSRGQEESVWRAMDQTTGEIALELARSPAAIEFILATDALVERGILPFSFVSRLQTEAAGGAELSSDENVNSHEGEEEGVLLPVEYEVGLVEARRLSEMQARGNPTGSDISRCARALKGGLFSLEYLSWMSTELARKDGASEPATVIATACSRIGELRHKMVSRHLGHVRRFVERFAERGLDPDDLLQEGAIGLLRAVELFDAGRGIRFWTYASWWVRQSIFRALDDKEELIRVPVHVREKMRQLRRMQERSSLRGEGIPSAAEIADRLGISITMVKQLLAGDERLFGTEAFDDAALDELERRNDRPFDDPYSQAAQAELTQIVNSMLLDLDPRAERVLRLRFGLGLDEDHTLEEVGQEFGVTRERIRQIEAKSLRKLAHPVRSRALRSYCEG